VALTKNGLFMWGRNDSGQLDVGYNYYQNTPHKIHTFIDQIVTITCGGFHMVLTKHKT